MEIKEVLEEIYSIDEDMRRHEQELKKIIRVFMDEKPDAKIDQAFVIELRNRLMKDVEEVSERNNVLFGFAWPNLAFAGAGAALTLLIMLPFATDISLSGFIKKDDPSFTRDEITNLPERAFGSLISGMQQDGKESLSGAMGNENLSGEFDASTARAYGLGGGESRAKPDMAMIMPNYESYEYKYIGEELILETEKAKVYKRVKSSGFDGLSANGLGAIAGNLLDLSILRNPKIQNFSINDDNEFGYSLHINAAEGTININKNWEKWPNPFADCHDEACHQRNRIKQDDIPNFNSVISIAENFIVQNSIDKSSYGEGFVHDYWSRGYEQSIDREHYYFPDELQVIFPLSIEGQTIYREDGIPLGLSVNVDIRQMRVSSVSTIRKNAFESSEYETETDSAKILRIAEGGGIRGAYYIQEELADENKKIIELGTPDRILMSYYKYDQDKIEGYELYVPALRFPIVSVPDGIMYFNREYVVIPLLKEILDEYEEPYIGIMPAPMPYLRNDIDGAGNSSGGDLQHIPEPIIEDMQGSDFRNDDEALSTLEINKLETER